MIEVPSGNSARPCQPWFMSGALSCVGWSVVRSRAFSWLLFSAHTRKPSLRFRIVARHLSLSNLNSVSIWTGGPGDTFHTETPFWPQPAKYNPSGDSDHANE